MRRAGMQLRDSLRDTVRTTAMVFLILIGAQIFTPFLAITQIPADLAGLLKRIDGEPAYRARVDSCGVRGARLFS